VQDYVGASTAAPPVSKTVCATFDAVAQTFQANDLPSPIHDNDGKLAFLLQRVLKGYTNRDGSKKPQKAITLRVVQLMLRNQNNDDNDDIDTACGQLCSGAWFFVMQSYEYSKVYGDRCTKLLCLTNLRFFCDGQVVPHDHPKLHLVDSITVTFFFQKSDERDATITQHRTFDPELCPVHIWAAIIKCILSYPETGPKTSINTYMATQGYHLENDT
jgi:hypothetical protein